MHGRSLVRTLDAGAIVIITIALCTLGLIAWTTRLIDRHAQDVEVTVVRQQLAGLARGFHGGLDRAASDSERWIANAPQHNAVFQAAPSGRFILGREGSRIRELLADEASLGRLEDMLKVLAGIDPEGQRVEMLRIGPFADENLAFVANLPSNGNQPRLAIGLIDFAGLSAALDGYGLALAPVAARAEDIAHANGWMAIDGPDGGTQAVIGWNSDRISRTITAYVLPILAAGLVLGLFVLMLLRRYWSQARDGFMSELRQVEALAHSDPLTGLPNRRALFEHLHSVTRDAAGLPPLTVMMLDLDGFKGVNDQYGHQAGDRLLHHAGEVFSEEMGPEGFVARLGGDEFVAVLPAVIDEAGLQRLHGRAQRALRERVSADGSASIGLSIGAACTAPDVADAEALLKMADLAVYSAKARGRGQALFYHPEMKRDVAYRRMLEHELRGAILSQALFVVYQPIVDAISTRVQGYEALVRWQHPVRGVIPPSDFIPIAEMSDLIVGLGNFVLERALSELGSAGTCRISVNATDRQLLAPGFISFVMDMLARHKVAPERLYLELTETSIVSDPDRLAAVMASLQARGVRFAIDDFGAGYSSLTHLLRFKFDVLKIDRGFIMSLDDKPEAPMIVTAIVSLARSLGMQVVGEGIETPAQHRFLASAGCGALQGYLFGRPAPFAQLGLAEEAKPATLDQNEQVA